MPNSFRDFIPADEATDHIGEGFKDFIPSPKAEVQEVAVVEEEVYACPDCEFSTSTKLALVGHKRKHNKKESK